MRVTLDRGLCAGHGRCYDVAPELFQDDEEGYSIVRNDGTVGPEADAARLAVRLCPERALSLAG